MDCKEHSGDDGRKENDKRTSGRIYIMSKMAFGFPAES